MEAPKITLEYLLSTNQPPHQQTLKLISKDSLYSYVFVITDPETSSKYAIKLMPMGHLPKTDSQPEMGSQESVFLEEKGFPYHKKTTPNPIRVEKELEYLQKFEGIGPHPESYNIYTDYEEIIS